jgi:hypothetical protein
VSALPTISTRRSCSNVDDTRSHGRRSCASLSPEHLCLRPRGQGRPDTYASAASELASTPSPDVDYSTVVVSLSKGLEVELHGLFVHIGNQLQNSDALNSQTGSRLRSFILGELPLTLGDYVAYLPYEGAKEKDDPLVVAFREAARGLEGGEIVTSNGFRNRLRDLNEGYRKKAAHTGTMSLEQARACAQRVIGEPGSPGLIASLVAWKVGAAPSFRSLRAPVPAGRRELSDDHLEVEFLDVVDWSLPESGEEYMELAGDRGEIPRIERSDSDSVIAVLHPHITLKKNGLSPLIFEARELAGDGVVDEHVKLLSGEAVHRMAKALSRGHVAFRIDGVIELSRRAGSQELILRLALERGGWSEYALSPESTSMLARIAADLAAGVHGELISRRRGTIA